MRVCNDHQLLQPWLKEHADTPSGPLARLGRTTHLRLQPYGGVCAGPAKESVRLLEQVGIPCLQGPV